MIENMSFGLDIELGFRHVWTRPTYPINNNILFFESVNLYTAVISETVCLFSNLYFHSLSFMKKNFLRNSPREKIYCAFILVKERERDKE